MDPFEVKLVRQYAINEIAGGLMLGNFLLKSDDPFVRSQLTQHAMDEFRHGWLWTELLDKKGTFTGRDYRMSLFINGLFHWSYMSENLYGVDRDGVQNWWGGKNDAAPLEAILECNGMDEQYDGHYGYHDDDLANRLMTYGLDYIFDTGALAFECLHTKHTKGSDLESNQHFKDKLIPQRVRDKIYRANPHRDLREERNV